MILKQKKEETKSENKKTFLGPHLKGVVNLILIPFQKIKRVFTYEYFRRSDNYVL